MNRCLKLIASVVLITLALVVRGSIASRDAASQSPGAVAVGDNFFDPTTATVAAGTTVVWSNGGLGVHTVTSDDGDFDSGLDASQYLHPGQMFSFAFTQGGTYPYHCHLHGAPGGVGMSGTIVVEDVATATPAASTEAPVTTAHTASPQSIPMTQAAATAAIPTASPTPRLASLGLFPTGSPVPIASATLGDSGGGVSTAVWVLLAALAAIVGLAIIGGVFYSSRR